MPAQDNLKVEAIFGRTASGSATGVPDLDQEEIRFATTALLGPGYLPSMIDQTANTSSFNVRQDTGANMNVKVGSGTTKKDGYVLLGTAGGQGAYIVRLDAATKAVAVPATDAVNPARYGVYLYIDDTAYSGTASRAYAQVACIRGTPAGSPTTPGPLATYSAYALLWEFQLPANATAVTNAILDAGTDRRAASVSVMTGRGTLPSGYVSTTTTQGSIGSSAVDLTSLTITWIALANRRYRISGYVRAQQVTGAGDAVVAITDGSNTVKENATYSLVNLAVCTMQPVEIVVPGAGSVTRKLRASTSGGTLSTLAAATTPAWLMVEDIGPQ